jgi:hypothetical protein
MRVYPDPIRYRAYCDSGCMLGLRRVGCSGFSASGLSANHTRAKVHSTS